MDILIPDLWLREYLDTKAKPEEIQKYLSLCGPSVERITKGKTGPLYSIEVTTNRVDSSSVYGIAREAATILPRFKISATLQPIKVKSTQKISKSVNYLTTQVDSNLCKRFTTVLVRNVKLAPSPNKIQQKLEDVEIRPINNIVDLSNYLMIALGQPVHTFDYNKIKGAKMILRESKKGEEVTTLDGKTHNLPGGDIVIEDGEGRLIDLCGIMGAKNSAIDENTKNVLLFVQHYNPARIRRTSMSLGARSQAAALFEKDLDPESIEQTIRVGIDMLVETCNGQPENKILDIYSYVGARSTYKPKKVEVSLDFIAERLGVQIPQKEVISILKSLGFNVNLLRVTSRESLSVEVPSFRANDISIPEDIVEEISRIYGYHNLPSQLMDGPLPPQPTNSPFEFEYKAKIALQNLGGIEIYTSSLVPQSDVDSNRCHSALRLKNPLGKDGEYLRNSLTPPLTRAVLENRREEQPFHLFEMSNVYLPKKGDLPEEKMVLAGIFSKNFDYRAARGTVEAFLKDIRVPKKIDQVGTFGYLENEYLLYYEFEVQKLQESALMASTYTPVPKYPPQVEDLTLIVQPRTLIGEVIDKVKTVDPQISSVKLVNSYENTQTLRIHYQHPEKTLTDTEVDIIRTKVILFLHKRGIETN